MCVGDDAAEAAIEKLSLPFIFPISEELVVVAHYERDHREIRCIAGGACGRRNLQSGRDNELSRDLRDSQMDRQVDSDTPSTLSSVRSSTNYL